MKTRMNLSKINPKAYQAMSSLEKYLTGSPLEPKYIELIKIRASQINACAFCIDMHTKDAKKQGESEHRIYALNAWRESPLFTPEERAILDLTESITLVAETHVPDEVYDHAKQYFDDEMLSHIIMAIVTINSWNRIAISTRMIPAK